MLTPIVCSWYAKQCGLTRKWVCHCFLFPSWSIGNKPQSFEIKLNWINRKTHPKIMRLKFDTSMLYLFVRVCVREPECTSKLRFVHMQCINRLKNTTTAIEVGGLGYVKRNRKPYRKNNGYNKFITLDTQYDNLWKMTIPFKYTRFTLTIHCNAYSPVPL